MKWYNPEYMGTIADWVSGLLTATGVGWAVYETRRRTKINYKFTAYISSKRGKEGVLTTTYKNNSDLISEIQAYGFLVYKRKFSRKSISNNSKYFKPGEKELKPNSIFTYEEEYPNPRTIYVGRDYFWIKPYILDMTGEYKFSRKRYKIMFDDLEKSNFFK
ncbi:hypothetical protein [Enterococcus devriesei]|uniref:hypothetical protein n=1 Tax=Enterococcus devriesei TaxID=319970 RepID=UPI0036D4003B